MNDRLGAQAWLLGNRSRDRYFYRSKLKKASYYTYGDDQVWSAFDYLEYTIGLWLFKGPSYTSACKRVLFPDRLKGCTKDGGYPSFSYNVTTRLEDHGGGLESMVPVFTVKERNSAAFLDFAKQVICPK